MTYQDSAKKIIKEHIKTAIYIDENAREPFASSSTPELFEEKLSLELYKDFANHNILLNTYKFDALKYNQQKDYLLNGRDFVLLDWKLDGASGEDLALEIISNIINAKPQILFCGVYTQEQPDVVFKNLLSFFSGITSHESDDIKLQLMLEEEDNYANFKSDLDDIVLNGSFEKNRITDFKNRFSNIFEKDFFNCNIDDLRNKLIECWCAYSDFQKSNSNQTKVESYKVSDKALLVRNTFIVILNKKLTKFDKLLGKFTQIIANYSNGFSLLMSLELNNIIQNKGMMIDPRITSISRELFAYHKMKDKDGFEDFIKDIMLSGVYLNLLDERITTIQSLNTPSKTFKPNNNELIKMNVYYNSIYRTRNNNLTFGDVFKYVDNETEEVCYYICINPLCDCAKPKNENTFYFAKGHKVEQTTIEKELKRSEEVFISYLPDNTLIRWSDSSDKGKPIYITPVPLTIPKTTIKNNQISAYRLKAQISKKEKLDLVYVTTLKQNYAQRIANHAFTHSIRVGISFFPNK